MHMPIAPIDFNAWVLEIPQIHLVGATRMHLINKYGVQLRSDGSIIFKSVSADVGGAEHRYFTTERKYADVAAATGHICGCESCFSCAVLALYRAHMKPSPHVDEED